MVDDRLAIINNHNKPIAVAFSRDSILTNFNLWQFYINSKIEPGTSKNIDLRGTWPNYLKSSVNQKVYFFFFDTDTILKYKDMDFIVRNKIYVSKMSISESELINSKWKIEY